MLKIEANPDDLTPLPIGSSSDLMVGQRVYAIGNPVRGTAGQRNGNEMLVGW